MRTILFASALLVTISCAPLSPADFATEAEYKAAVSERQDRLERAGRYAEAARLIAVQQIEIWKVAGIGDLIQWDESRLLKASAFCATATALATVINPDMTDLTSEGAQWCAEILKVLAADPAPEVAPLPTPSPAA